jgi:DNA repair exonuclease SbcCD nuclease subunit
MKVIRSIIKHEQFRPHQDCLFTHIGVRSATLNTCFLIKDWSTVTFDDTPFKRIYTGHFHSQQQVGDNLWYPGSPIPFKFDEGDVPHGFYVYDTQRDDHHFVDIWQAGEKFFPDEPAPPQFITILDDSIPEQTSQQVKNCIVRVALQREYTNHEKSQIKQKILALDAANVRWMDVCKRDEQPRSSQPTVVHNDLFASWISQDTDNIHDLDVKILSRCNQEVVHQADELYSIESSEE